MPRYKSTLGSYIIENGLACYEDGGYFRHLYDLYEAGELTRAINRIIKDMNHRFVVRALTDDFESDDLGQAARNLRKESAPEKRTDALDSIDIAAVTKRLMELLDIRNREEHSVGITQTHIAEIKEYLAALDLIVDCPVETATPGVHRWSTSCLHSRGCATFRLRCWCTL